ncbi:MAG: ParB N-terminal domain-containing protein [Deltaproteobacteria bacterium]|nr:ParB N-terminal domain-containing protein [Deltaproteobacteria bacterium]
MDDIYSRIKIIPIAECLIHEGIVEKWVDQIAANIKDQGKMKNPVIVTRHDAHYIVLDGMHRFAALKKLGVKDILACEVDYFSPKIVLAGWDAFVFSVIDLADFLPRLFNEKEGYRLKPVAGLENARKQVLERKLLLAFADKKGTLLGLEKQNASAHLLEELCFAADKIDRTLSQNDAKVLYVENSQTLGDFGSSNATAVIFRPQFTKQEVIDHTLHKKLFAPKSTRHLIPERPLRVDIDLSLLTADIDLKIKNRVLQDHLKWCYENNRARFYPESVHIFAD